MSKDLVTMTIEIDREVYNKAAELFKNLGTTIEDMTVGFLKYCVIPENLPLLKAYLGILLRPHRHTHRLPRRQAFVHSLSPPIF